jgi:hypothetical protein
MAEDHRSRGPPPRDIAEDTQYPPPPGEDDERARSYHLPPPPTMTPGVTLPSIQDSQGTYGPPAAARGYPPPDPRSRGGYSASPTNSNGYPPPPGSNVYLPPVYAAQDPRFDPAAYYAHGRPPYADPYAAYPGYRGPPGMPYPYPPDYARAAGGAQAQQAAPRQRTSIACRYCRKRKIRCSGYQNTTNGKCTNCDKLRIECVFQPVSSNATQAFIPVNAIPGGVPPGTPLYGAYGQPLPPAGAGPGYGAPPPPHDYPMALASPTTSYPPPMDERAEADWRRSRPQDDEHARRLPPPGPYQDEDPRRRSPASNQSSNTPPTSYIQQQQGGMREVDRTPTPQRNSPAGGAPAGAATTTAGSTSTIMSLGNLMDHAPGGARGETGRDIDKNMLGRLNRRS